MARIYDSGLFVTFPIQMLAAPVTEVHEFPFHGHMASGADIITISIGKAHNLCYWHFHTVAGKDEQKVGKDSRGKGCLPRRFRFQSSSAAPIILFPPGTSQQIRRNNGPSFSTVRSSLGIVPRPRTVGSYAGHRKVLPQFLLGICRLLYGPAEVDFQDGLRPPLRSSAFFFMVIMIPPSKFLTGHVPFFILEETLPRQHGACVGLQKKRNFVVKHNKMGRQRPAHFSGILSQCWRITALLRCVFRQQTLRPARPKNFQI